MCYQLSRKARSCLTTKLSRGQAAQPVGRRLERRVMHHAVLEAENDQDGE